MGDVEKTQSLSKVIGNLVWCKIKEVDAPISASTHFNTALYELLKICPDYQESNLEEAEVLNEAWLEMKLLGVTKK